MPPAISSRREELARLVDSSQLLKSRLPPANGWASVCPDRLTWVLDLVQHLADLAQDHAGIGFDLRTGRIEHRPVLFVDDLDAQAFAGQVEQQLVLELLQGRIGVDHVFQFGLEPFQALAFHPLVFGLQLLQVDGLARRLDVAGLDLADRAVRSLPPP
jgi:hypothetical protein